MNNVSTSPANQTFFSVEEGFCPEFKLPQPMNLGEICEKFFLNEKEKQIVIKGVNCYCSDSRIKSLINSTLYYPQSFLGNTPWQKAVQVLESKIDGEQRKEVAIFLLKYCLTMRRICAQQGPLPISWNDWVSGNLGTLTFENCLKYSNCTNNTLPLNKNGEDS